MLSYCAIGQNRQAVLSIASKCAILGGMAFTAFVSKSKPGNQAHNERDFDVKHPEPAYFLAHWHRGDNIYIKQDLTAKEVYRDYVRTSAYGRKSGRLHHSAKPVREAVIVCKMDTTEKQVRTLIRELEKDLGIRALYAHVHKDEGHFDEKTWRVKHNPHIHFGYTNLVIERDEKGHRHGRLTDMNKTRMQQAQDICAEALGMERAPHYTKETRKKNLPHQVYRAQQQAEAQAQAALDAVEKKTAAVGSRAATAEQKVTDLVAENSALRNKLKDSGIAKQADYQGLKRIKDSDLSLEEKVVKMAEYVDKVLTPVEETPAEELPAPSPITPERGVATTLEVPRRRQLASSLPASTPAPAPVPVVELFTDTMRGWMERERKKREAADEKATKAKEDLIAVKLERDKAKEQLGFWKQAAIEARGLVKTLSRFILALDKGFKYAWPRRDVATFAQDLEPNMWFKDTEIDAFSKKLNGKVDHFNAAQVRPKTQVTKTPERDRGGRESDD